MFRKLLIAIVFFNTTIEIFAGGPVQTMGHFDIKRGSKGLYQFDLVIPRWLGENLSSGYEKNKTYTLSDKDEKLFLEKSFRTCPDDPELIFSSVKVIVSPDQVRALGSITNQNDDLCIAFVLLDKAPKDFFISGRLGGEKEWEHFSVMASRSEVLLGKDGIGVPEDPKSSSRSVWLGPILVLAFLGGFQIFLKLKS